MRRPARGFATGSRRPDHLPLEGGGRPAPAGPVGVTAAPQIRSGCLGGAAATPPRTAFRTPTLPLQGRHATSKPPPNRAPTPRSTPLLSDRRPPPQVRAPP